MMRHNKKRRICYTKIGMWLKQYVVRIKLLKILIKIFILAVVYFIVTKVIFRGNRIKILIWWTPFMPNRDRVIECSPGGYKCLLSNNRQYITDDKLGAFLFYGSKLENFDFPLPRNTQIPWAIFHEESPKNNAPFLYRETQDLFNITSTFSQNSDFPVTLQYLKNISHIKDKKYYKAIENKNNLLQKYSPILYVQSDCDTPIGRDYFIKELSKYINIDSYGSCLNNKSFPTWLTEVYPLDLYNDNYLQFVSYYKFVISIENSICTDYVTEKFWRPLIAGSVPIYLGAPNIEDYQPNDNSAILVKNFVDVKSLANFIQEVNEDDSLYNSFLEHKLLGKIENKILLNGPTFEHPIPEFECFVCTKVHGSIENYEKNGNSIYDCPKPSGNNKNTWDQHWDIGKCQSKALKMLVERDEPYTKDIFDNTWKELLKTKRC